MKSYNYPTAEQVGILLDQNNYTAGGAAGKAYSAEIKVSDILTDINKMISWVNSLENKIQDAQKICYLNEMYGVLFHTNTEHKSEAAITRIQKRKEEQRKLRARREREKKSVETRRKTSLFNAIHQASSRPRWRGQ